MNATAPATLLAAVLILAAAPALAARRRDAPPDTTGRFVTHEIKHRGVRHRYAVWLPPGWTRERRWPGVLFLHGSGESGTDGEKPTRVGLGPALARDPARWLCVVVFPQKPSEEHEWEEHEDLVIKVLDDAGRRHPMEERFALTGISQGGHGVWVLGARHPERWSCLAPVCGYGRWRTVARRVADLPVWAFHGLRDDLVNPEDTRQIVTAIRAERERRGLAPEGDSGARMTLYPEANHNAWDPAYAEPDLPGWLLAPRTRERPAPDR